MDFKCIFLGLIMAQMSSCSFPRVDEFFPDIKKDISMITWAHAINSKSLLEEAISDGSYMMLEADVSEGKLEKIPSTMNSKPIPIMAHPPNTTSDLSLQMFVDRLIEVNKKGKKIGMKLDFKDLNIVVTSLEILRRVSNLLNFPVWLNADILKGPGGDDKTPVDAEMFLSSCSEFFPEATLSVGWTTGTTGGAKNLKYTNEMVEEMINTLKNSSISQPVTFPVRAAFVWASIDALKNLKRHLPWTKVETNQTQNKEKRKTHPKESDYTFTVWTSSSDEMNIEDLSKFEKAIGPNSVFFDLPQDQIKELRKFHKLSKMENRNYYQRKQQQGEDNENEGNYHRREGENSRREGENSRREGESSRREGESSRREGENSAQTNFNFRVMFVGFVCVAFSVLGVQYFR